MKLYKYLLPLCATEQAAEMHSNFNFTVLILQCCVISVFGSFVN